jgi:6-phosphogluconate dehydrogenase
MEPLNDSGVVGLGVMGRSLVANPAGRGHRVGACDLSASATLASVAEAPGRVDGAESPRTLRGRLARPRKLPVPG